MVLIRRPAPILPYWSNQVSCLKLPFRIMKLFREANIKGVSSGPGWFTDETSTAPIPDLRALALFWKWLSATTRIKIDLAVFPRHFRQLICLCHDHISPLHRFRSLHTYSFAHTVGSSFIFISEKKSDNDEGLK